MDYTCIYAEFIGDRRLKEPPLNALCDRHHIVPRCIRRDNSAENLIRLTFADHLFAHLLLAKLYGGKLIPAANLMLNRVRGLHGKIARRKYNWVRAAHAQEMSRGQTKRMSDPELRARTRAALTGYVRSKTEIEKSATARKGKSQSHSAETRAAQARRLTKQRQGSTFELARLAALRAANTGREKSPTEITKISDGMKSVWQKRKAGLLPRPKAA